MLEIVRLPSLFVAHGSPNTVLDALSVGVPMVAVPVTNEQPGNSASVARDMARELGAGNNYPDLLPKMARLEVVLTRFAKANLHSRQYGVFADKCWPAFESYFGFVPCYVNSRLAARGIPVACEVDIYGALSEYIATCATELPATILDINNTVPYDMIAGAKKAVKGYKATDLFMGFHCGNTPAGCMLDPAMRYQLIMHRLMEPGKEPDVTRGTLEGRIKTGAVTIFLGFTLLAHQIQAVPSPHETIISQLARAIYGNNLLYYLTLAGGISRAPSNRPRVRRSSSVCWRPSSSSSSPSARCSR